jgi:hypothetical protein
LGSVDEEDFVIMSATSRIRELVQAKLAGRKIDVVGFVDELLAIVAETGEIHCCLASEQALRFETRDGACEVELDSCRGKLRILCARLGVLCNDAGGATASLYGGEGIVCAPSNNGTESAQWTVRFKNTPDEHELTIIPVKGKG